MNKKITAAAACLLVLFGITGLTMADLDKAAPTSPVQAPAQTSAPLEKSEMQTLVITAKGGYTPEATILQAGIPTLLRIHTQSSFDCSTSLVIPALGFDQQLPPTGDIEVTIPAQAKGQRITGRCAMGMYSFTISFF